MKRTYIQTNNLEDLTIMNIVSIGSTIFFTATLLFSVYLMSENLNKQGFIALALGSFYFMARNTMNFKCLYVGTWFGIFALAMKGVVGY